MPGHVNETGRIVQRDLGSFLWRIPGFSGLPRENGIWFYSSPFIHLAETKWWMLAIYPNGTHDFPHRIVLRVLRLWRWDEGLAKTFHFRVGVRHADGKEELVGKQTVKVGVRYLDNVLFPFYKRAEECREGEILSSDTLAITLRITEEGEAAPPGVMILSQHITDLLEYSEDCDVKIHVNDKEFLGHRCILKSRSPVFRMMLTHDCIENNSGVISIRDCDTEAFEELMFYMYSGKTRDLTPNQVFNLYYIADKYSFSELKEQCVSSLETSLKTSNICDVILLYARHEETDLFNTVMNFFAQNIEEILETVEWENFMAKHPKKANELYKRSLKSFLPKK